MSRLFSRMILATFAVAALGAPLSSCAHLPFLSRSSRSARPAALATARVSPAAGVASTRPTEAPSSTPSLADVQVGAARTAMSSAPEQAEQALLAAIAAEPHHAVAIGLLAKLYYAQGRYAEGVEALRVAQEQPDQFEKSDRAKLLAMLALLQEALGESVAAREAVVRAHEASAREASSTALYLELRRPTAAGPEELSRTVERSAAGDAAALNNVGIAKLRRGDVDGARRAFESAIARDSALPGPWYNLAILEQWWKHDRDAASRRFAQYWRLSHDAPDGLVAVFGDVVAAAAKPEAGR